MWKMYTHLYLNFREIDKKLVKALDLSARHKTSSITMSWSCFWVCPFTFLQQQQNQYPWLPSPSSFWILAMNYRIRLYFLYKHDWIYASHCLESLISSTNPAFPNFPKILFTASLCTNVVLPQSVLPTTRMFPLKLPSHTNFCIILSQSNSK